MNESMLRELAATTGGAFFREEDLHKLPDTIRLKTERVQSPLEVELGPRRCISCSCSAS